MADNQSDRSFDDFVALFDRPQTCAEEEAMWSNCRQVFEGHRQYTVRLPEWGIHHDEEGRAVITTYCLECGKRIETLVSCTRASPAVCWECDPSYLSVTDQLIIADLFND